MKTRVSARPTGKGAPRSLGDEVDAVLASLKRLGNMRTRDDMGPRYGIHADKAFGVPMSSIQQVAKGLGRNHELALALWETGWYEARLLAAFVDEPAMVTSAQMDRWCRDFDNWAVCDTICFHLFDRTPHAFGKVVKWSRRRDEFVKRAAFALLACLAAHDRQAGNDAFIRCLSLIEDAADDERNFVKKGVSWALRMIGRRNRELNAAAVEVAQRLAASSQAAPRSVGKEALRELTNPKVTGRLDAKRRAPAA